MGAAAGGVEGRGMPRTALSIVLAAVALGLAAAPAQALDEAGYWRFVDRMQDQMDRYWSEDAGYFTGTYPGANGNALLTYAVAARRGHEGPARNDRRARRLVDALVSSPPFLDEPPPRVPGSLGHAPGWVNSMESRRGL